MALDPEELKKRRQARQAQRQRRQAQTRGLLIKLGIAAVVVLLCGILIFTLAGQDRDETPAAVGDNTAATDSTEKQDTETTVIHLAAAGDLNVTQRLVDAGDADRGYTDLFMDVTPVLAQADITVLNFEGNFFGAPYGEDRSAPQSMATSLSKAGVDMIQLANSYSIYKGMDGLNATVSAVRSAGMEPVGAYANVEEAKAGKGYTIRNVNGVKIAFVAFTKGMDGMALPSGNERCVNLLYTDYATDYQKVDTEGITKVLSAVKRERPDLTVALLHWGSEYNNTISQTQNEICTLLKENGADAIIGTHSHYVQKMELDPETGTFVAYSLGDFAGDANRAGSEYSVILDLEITKNNRTGSTKITNFTYTPIFTVAEEGKPLRIVRIQEAVTAYDSDYIDKVSDTTYEAMKYALTRIEARIKGE